MRLLGPQREQRELIGRTFEELLAAEHLARDIGAITGKMDLLFSM